MLFLVVWGVILGVWGHADEMNSLNLIKKS